MTFETKSSMLSLKDERQWTGYLWLRKKQGHYIREYILCKERLDRKRTQDMYPRRVDKAIRVHFEKCLLCTLYQKEFILSSFKVVISHTCLIWPTSDEACVSWNIQIYFWIWYEPILTFLFGKVWNNPHDGIKLA